ncbi:hypothetical protein FKW77_003841 [Venturia effusa]|uniref:Uncharacterized protein n=1 Tax=Venturia effusa TaxID=50376 RepID=A0A517KZ94_9PEZI|nr:hypothetical protein FKW77_003841 [Venturia effusa]
MPAISDIVQFFGGQVFGKTFVPEVDLSGKTIIITGANIGLGFEAAKHLARRNVSKLILACRDVKKGEAAKIDILNSIETNTAIEVWEVDLSKYESVVAFGRRVRTELPRLDAFVANAGLERDTLELAEGLELSLTVNVVSTLMSAIAVLPKLKETALEHFTTTTLEFVGSMVHIFGSDKSLEVPEGQSILEALSQPGTDMPGRYNLSKLLEHLCFNQLSEIVCVQQRDAKARVVLNIVNPGWCKSSLGRSKSKGAVEKFFEMFLQRTAEMGGRTLAHGAMVGEQFDGCYLSECQAKPQSTYVRSARGKQTQKRLWKEVVSRIELASPEVAGFVA